MTVRVFLLPWILILLSGCSSTELPAGPGKAWSPPESEIEASQTLLSGMRVEISPEQIARKWSLGELIDLALGNNSYTMASWLWTKAAAAGVGSAYGRYYPQITGGAALSKNRQAYNSTSAGTSNLPERTASVPIRQKELSAEVNYLLFDFGKREAEVDEAVSELLIANYDHDAALQDVVLLVQQSYYAYISLKSLSASRQQAVKEAELSLESARARHAAGVATIADVLQAETVLSRTKLSLAEVDGQIKVARGTVAAAVGVSPTTAFDVEDNLAEMSPVDQVTESVEELLRQAEQTSPALSAARARYEKAGAHAAVVYSDGLPALTAGARGDEIFRSNERHDNYTLTLNLSFPIFTGFSDYYDTARAKAEEEASKADFKTVWERVSLAVWSDYSNYKTAIQRIETSQALVKSAAQSHDVALGRYREGVGSILDLLSAQTALEDARTREIQARVDWLLALAQLKRDVGRLSMKGN